jgi:hypothetical protein
MFAIGRKVDGEKDSILIKNEKTIARNAMFGRKAKRRGRGKYVHN